MRPTITDAVRRARLADRHRLLPHRATDDVPALAESVLALHSTDPVTVYLSAAARMASPSIEGVDQALYAERNVLRHHAMRRTLWIATPPTLARMHATTTAVYAAADGEIISAGGAGGYGNRIIIDHGMVDGADLATTYNHLSRIVRGGGSVSRGQLIGYVGTTGLSTGCHLHFEALVDGNYVNPMRWL